jgi:hypothetical protein
VLLGFPLRIIVFLLGRFIYFKYKVLHVANIRVLLLVEKSYITPLHSFLQ